MAAKYANLVTITDIAKRLGVTKQWVHTLANSRPAAFPRPVATIGGHRVWEIDDVKAWAATHNRVCK